MLGKYFAEKDLLDQIDFDTLGETEVEPEAAETEPETDPATDPATDGG